MKKIKIKNKEYDSAYVPDYNILRKKLYSILSQNRKIDDFKFYGIKKNNKLGILVDGTDSRGVRNFIKFFESNKINHLFDKR